MHKFTRFTRVENFTLPLPTDEDMEDEGTKEGGVPAEGDVHPLDLTPR